MAIYNYTYEDHTGRLSEIAQRIAVGEFSKGFINCYFKNKQMMEDWESKQKQGKLKMTDLIELHGAGEVYITVTAKDRPDLTAVLRRERGDTLTRIFHEGLIAEESWRRADKENVDIKLLDTNEEQWESTKGMIANILKRDRENRKKPEEVEVFLANKKMFTDFHAPAPPSTPSEEERTLTEVTPAENSCNKPIR